MKIPFFDYPKLFLDKKDEYLNIFSEVSSRGAFIMQKDVDDFEKNLSQFSEEVDITKSSLRIGLSAVDQTYISIVLNENVVNDQVKIFRGFLDSNNSLISDPFLLYDGQIDTFEINDWKSILILLITKCQKNYLILTMK